MNIHVASTPKHLKITQMMVDDFLIDPVMGAEIIFKVKLDAFQKLRLRTYWWIPNVIDSSGFGTGKSFGFWLFMNLRCVIIGDQHACAYYQTFDAGKEIFWPYYTQFNARNAPLFAAQLGKVDTEGDIDGKDNTRGPACFYQHFKNESKVLLPAPNWFQDAKGQAGKTYNVAGIDEWTKVETMTRKTTRVMNSEGSAAGGINQQIIGRVRRASFNQWHPLWCNHKVFLATAESPQHAANHRVRVFQREIAKGNPDYSLISFSFKDVSNLRSHTGKTFREQIVDWKTIQDMKANLAKAHFLREGLGIWARDTAGWYSEESLNKCVALGMNLGLEPEISRTNADPNVYYFMGADPAPAQGFQSDDGALAILRVRPRPGLNAEPTSNPADWIKEFVWAYRVRARSRGDQEAVFWAENSRDWSGLIHWKHRAFNLGGILMDPNGGGQWIMGDLNKTRQRIIDVETVVTPITTLGDMSGNAYPLLTLYKRGENGVDDLWPLLHGDDNLYEAMHVEFQQVVNHLDAAFPLPFNERPRVTTEAWPTEKQWALKNLDAMREQLTQIQVETHDDGSWVLTRNNAKKFSAAAGKKDLAYAGIFAYIRFLLWLKMNELDFSNPSGSSSVMYVMKA